jgi:hypothetical protein
VATIGDKAAGQVIEVIEKAAAGEIPAAEAVRTLIEVYNFDPRRAALLIPKTPTAAAKKEKDDTSSEE